jgi:hypothetical protein
MKKLLAIIVTALVLTGCMTANMLEAERSYYQAIVKLQAAKAAQPLFELTPAKEGEPIVLGNVGSFKVYAPVAGSDKEMRQYTQTDYVGPWLRVVSAALPWIGAWGIAHEVAKSAGDTITSYNQSVSGSNNAAGMRTSSIQTGNMGDGNSLSGMTEINDSYNPTTITTTTTTTDNHTTTTTTENPPAEPVEP